MKNFVQPGKALNLTAPSGGVTAGVALLIVGLIVVPATDADETKTFSGHTEGVFTLAKNAGEAFAEGDVVYFDVSEGDFTKTATGNYRAGVAVAAALSAATEADIRLDGVSTVAEA